MLKITPHKIVPYICGTLKRNHILMQYYKKNILFIFSRFYLLLLYIPFFIVQGFFNFDTQGSHNTKTFNTSISVRSKTQQGVSYFNTNKSPDKKAGIRLNKRFQPKNAPILISPSFELAVYFIKANLFDTYTDPLFSPAHFLTKKLRGPPIIA